jgi:hypothetical protein
MDRELARQDAEWAEQKKHHRLSLKGQRLPHKHRKRHNEAPPPPIAESPNFEYLGPPIHTAPRYLPPQYYRPEFPIVRATPPQPLVQEMNMERLRQVADVEHDRQRKRVDPIVVPDGSSSESEDNGLIPYLQPVISVPLSS